MSADMRPAKILALVVLAAAAAAADGQLLRRNRAPASAACDPNGCPSPVLSPAHVFAMDESPEPAPKLVHPEIPVPPTLGQNGNFGIPLDKLAGTKEGWQFNGVEVSAKTARTLIEDAGKLTDESALIWLVAVGSAAARAAVEQDLANAPELTAWRDKVRFQQYDPNSAIVAQRGFKRDGNPAVHVLAPNGASLARRDSYQGPAHLANMLRNAAEEYARHPTWSDPKSRPVNAVYDPSKDSAGDAPIPQPMPSGPTPGPVPTPNPAPDPTPSPSPGPINLGGALALLIAAVLYWLVRRPMPAVA